MLKTGQTASPPRPAFAPTITPVSRVFHLDAVTPSHSANGGEGWDFGGGELTTGEWVKAHESMQPAGAQPNPAHRIDHTELICVLEGELDYMHEGVTERAVTGDILLVAKGTFHQLRNVSAGPLRYFVLAIGGDVHA
jgi:mannose-6-phosphate isomerase-like protein (cupin superfamily)